MRKHYIAILSCLTTLAVSVSSVYGNNDGMPTEDIYADSGYMSSYGNDVDYYDCQIPYNITYGDLGGYATGGISTNASYTRLAMDESTKDKKVGTAIIREGCCSSEGVIANTPMGRNHSGSYDVSLKHDEDGFCIAIDRNGAEYYIAALPEYFYNCSKVTEDGFSGFRDYSEYNCNYPTIYDVILTDGTCIHFVRGDSIGTDHSIGGTSGNQDQVHYDKSNINFPQYRGIGHAIGGQMIEIWGNSDCDPNKFNEKYNIGSEDNQNKISYIRMYNRAIFDAPQRKNGNEISTNLGSASEGGNSTHSGTELVDEWELLGMPEQGSLEKGQNDVRIEDRSNLSISEVYNIEGIGEDIELNNKTTVVDTVRTFFVFVGMVMTVYAILLGVAIVVDKVNTFIEISLVGLLTFGKVKYRPQEIDNNYKGKEYTTTRKMIIICATIFIIGLFMLSGGILKVYGQVMVWLVEKFL